MFWNIHVKTPSLDALDVKTYGFCRLVFRINPVNTKFQVCIHPGLPSCGCLVGRFGEPQDPRRSDLSVTGPLQDFPPAAGGGNNGKAPEIMR